jgi:hypothetical protein
VSRSAVRAKQLFVPGVFSVYQRGDLQLPADAGADPGRRVGKRSRLEENITMAR